MAKKPKSAKSKIGKELSGIAGEYFVAGELTRRGLIAAITLRNTRGADILVSHPEGNTPSTIQVKTQQGATTEWLLGKRDEIQKGGNHYYVFVALNGQNGVPEYFVVPDELVSKQIAADHKEWLAGRKRDGTKRKDTSMRVFRPTEKFRNAWHTIDFG